MPLVSSNVSLAVTMMIFHLLLSGVSCLPLSLQLPILSNDLLNPYPDKPRLLFKPDGTFKITVFSDLHFGENPWDSWGPEQDINSTRLMNTVLSDEKPSYVVLNGDLITGENTFKENSTKLIDEIVAPLNTTSVPFSSTHGNHDNQVNITHAQEIARELQVAPRSYTRASPPGVGGVGGPGNYWVPIYKKVRDRSPALILWFFDSRGGFDTENNPLPDYVDASVATWIQSETKAMNRAWGPPATRKNLVFVHIPPHRVLELQAGVNATSNPGLNADVLGDGSVQSSSTPLTSCQNSCDEPFWNAVNNNIGTEQVIAVVSGHDHGNEWCTLAPTSTSSSGTTKDLIFCFDKHSGYGGYTSDGWNYGVRNFVIDHSSPSVRSWIRYEAGDVKAAVQLESGKITVEQ